MAIPEAVQSPAKTDAIIGAYYYPWYYPARWTNELVTNTPRLGRYESGDRAVAARHIQWAKQAGIDFFMVSWLSPLGREDANLKNALLPELAKANYRFALLYETPLALGLPAGQPLDLNQILPDGNKAGKKLIAQFDYLANFYFRHPCFLKHQGKAVVVVYVTRDLVHAELWFKRLRKAMSERGLELYLVADVVYWGAAEKLDWRFLRQNFQAITAYNMYLPLGSNLLEPVRRQFHAVSALARKHGLRLIPNVMPGYDDTKCRGTGRVTIDRDGGQFYREYWTMAAEFLDPGQPFLLITSFNEWHEGTELEPSEEYGDTYLQLTRELAAPFR